jgi:membrane protein YqaA with SNARE-associated domain
MSEVLVIAARPASRAATSIRSVVGSWPEPVRLALALAAMIALSVGIILAPIDYKAFGNYGYLGVFIVTLVATAALVFPVPYLGVIVVAGSFLNPALVALVAGLAAALGEMTGYILGRTGRALLPNHPVVGRLERAMGRFGAPIVFAGAAIPNPLFDAIGLIAGATRMPVWMFLIPCFLGKTLRFWGFATLGGFLPG